jgi:hypothetical protein
MKSAWIFLLVSVSVFGQAPHGNNSGSHNPEKQTNRGKNPPASTITVIQKNCNSDQFKNDADCKAAEEKDATVSVSKLPIAIVSIQRIPDKDKYDWLAYWAGVALSLVGVGGVWIAVVTVRAVKRQVDTFISKERGRLTVDVEAFIPEDPKQKWYANLIISNHGSTNVFIGPALCLSCINVPQWDMKDAVLQLQIDLPKVIPPNIGGIKFAAPIQIGNKLSGTYDFKTIDEIGNGTKGVFVVGLIEYWDVFDERWSLKFTRKWGGSLHNSSWVFTKWKDYGRKHGGPAEANGEYKIEEPSIMRRLARWILRRDPNTVVARWTNYSRHPN